MSRGTAKGSVLLTLLLAACAGLVLLAAGCGDDAAQREAAAAAARKRAAAAALHARRMVVGRRGFAKHCETCHTLGGKHYVDPIIEFEAPNLDEVRLPRDYVVERIEYGGPAMASFTGEMTRAEFAALAEFVTEAAGRDVHD